MLRAESFAPASFPAVERGARLPAATSGASAGGFTNLFRELRREIEQFIATGSDRSSGMALSAEGAVRRARMLWNEGARNTIGAASPPEAGRVSGLYRMVGREQSKIASAEEGETVALGKLDKAETGGTLTTGKTAAPRLVTLSAPPPVFSIVISPRDRKDEVKLSAALQKLLQEDPSLVLEQNRDSNETVLGGQGEMHLRIARERLEGKYQIAVETRPPSVPYRETIRKAVTQRGRHKKQSGGHGQFGDVLLEIKPLPRGSGFEFTESITGGVVPKQYIPSVETGVRDALQQGPLGFPVVDIAVNLADGSYHTVDSSDMAFQLAARLAMKEGLAAASPVLLEPILKVEVDTPSDATAKITAILSQRRGQILGFETRTDQPGWDIVEALLPEAEMDNLIIELRSATAGVATYRARFDHMAELTGRLADDALSSRGKAA